MAARALDEQPLGAEMGERERFEQFGLAGIVAVGKIAGEAARQVEQVGKIGEDRDAACGGRHHCAPAMAPISDAVLLSQDGVEHVGDEALLGARQA